MAWSVLQSASHNADVSPGTSISATFTTSNCVSGSKIIVLVVVSDSGTGNVTVTSVKDGGGTSWTQLATAAYTNGDGNIYLFALDTPAGDVGAKPTITAATSNVGGGTAASILIMEVSGLLAGNTSAMLDGSAGTTTGSGGASTTSPTYSSSAANEFLLAVYGDYEDVTTTWTNPSGYTGATAGPGSAGAVTGINASFSANAELAYKNSTGGSESASFGMNATTHWATMLVAFKLAGGGPTSGPAFFPARQAVRARPAPGAPRSGTASAELAPGTGNISGPVNGAARGGGTGAAGGPVRNPSRGPLFRQAVQAVRARLPQPLLRGRCYSSPRAPVRNPSRGPVFRQKPAPVRYVLPPWRPRAGRVGSAAGGPVINPIRGPAFFPRPFPVQAQDPPPRKGRVYSTARPAVTVTPPPPAPGPVFRQASQPARARQPLPRRGRTASSRGVPFAGYLSLRFPAVPGIASPGITSPGVPFTGTQGPVFFPLDRPARARIPQPFSKGRCSSGPGGPVRNPVPVTAGPVFFPKNWPAAAQDPLPRRGRIAGISAGAPVRNPQSGPVFSAAVRPCRAPVPQVFSKGRTTGNPGAPVANPVRGPVFRQATAPARIRPSLPPRGRTASNPGGPVRNPVPGVQGPPFFPLHWPARTRVPQNAPRGRTSGNAGAPVRNSHAGAAFPAWHGPVRARQPLPPRGRCASNPGGPLRNPPPLGPVIPQRGQPVQARLPLPPRGRTAGGTGAPLITSGPRFIQATRPARARQPLPPRGRTGSNPGTPVPVTPVVTGPRFTPRHDPARIRPSLPPCGRTAGGRGAPVRNPSAGPVFRQAVRPVRAVIPQNAPRGRASGSPGGPVANIPFGNPLFRLGSPYFQWDTGTPGMTSEWSTGSPAFAWDTGVPVTSA